MQTAQCFILHHFFFFATSIYSVHPSWKFCCTRLKLKKNCMTSELLSPCTLNHWITAYNNLWLIHNVYSNLWLYWIMQFSIFLPIDILKLFKGMQFCICMGKVSYEILFKSHMLDFSQISWIVAFTLMAIICIASIAKRIDQNNSKDLSQIAFLFFSFFSIWRNSQNYFHEMNCRIDVMLQWVRDDHIKGMHIFSKST